MFFLLSDVVSRGVLELMTLVLKLRSLLVDTEWLRFWILGIQTSRKVTWFGEWPDGKNIVSLQQHILCLKFNTLMCLSPTILDFLVSSTQTLLCFWVLISIFIYFYMGSQPIFFFFLFCCAKEEKYLKISILFWYNWVMPCTLLRKLIKYIN